MAIIKADNFTSIINTGTWGERSGRPFTATLAAAAIADVVELGKIPAGCLLVDWLSHNAALGALTTLSYGFKYVDGSAGDGTYGNPVAGAAVLSAAAATATAGMTRNAIAPLKFDKDVIITVTVGGAAATGAVNFVPDYIYQGNL